MRMATKGMNAGSWRQCQRFVQTLGRCRQGARSWWLESTAQKRTVNAIITECAPLQHHPCIRNRHQNCDAGSPPRGMSTNTKRGGGGSVQSKQVLEKETGSSAHDKADKWRRDFMEKQSKQKKFDNVKAPPPIKDEDWWTPDPMTGVYVPEYYHGCVTTAPRESKKRSSGGGASYLRIDTDQDQDQAPWFENMEELPDMDRHKKK